MQVFKGSRDLCRVEAGIVLRDAFPWPGLQRSEELATTAIFHAQVEIVLGLERVVQGHDEGMIARGQDLLFGQGPLDLVALDHLLLAQHCTATKTSQ